MSATFRNSIHTRTILCGAFVTLMLFAGRGSAEDINVGLVVKELRSGIVRLDEAEVRLKTWEAKQELVGGKSASVSFLIKRHEKSLLMEFKKTRIIKRNSEIFSVKPALLNREWVLINYNKSGTDRVWQEIHTDGHFAYYPLLAVADGSTILHILDNPTFVPKRARQVANNRVELEYEYTVSAIHATTEKVILSGTFTLASDLDWLAVKSVTRTTGSPFGQIDCVMERQAVRDGDLIRIVATTYGCGGPNVPHSIKSKFTYKPLPTETVDPSEFTLGYYNLTAPEHDVYEDRQSTNWVLWGGIGVGCIALSLVLRWYVRRRRST